MTPNIQWVATMRKILSEIVFCVVLYSVACGVTGAIAGMTAGGRSSGSATAARAGQQAGARAVADHQGYLCVGAVVATAIGSCLGILPGTREH